MIDTDLFEHAERQVKLEKDYDKKLYIDAIEPIKESDTKNIFSTTRRSLFCEERSNPQEGGRWQGG